MSRSTGSIQVGDKLEFIVATKDYAMGYTTGGFMELQTPNDNATYVTVGGFNGNWQILVVPQTGGGIDPVGKDSPVLVTSGVDFNNDNWLECPLSNAQCTGGVLA
jgi:hypothetical protein